MLKKKPNKRKKILKKKVKKLKPQKKILETKKTSIAEQKVIIKKIKKQPNEKREYNVNDHVVYPKHGVGKITSVDKAVIGEIGINYYKILVERDKLTLTIPINQQDHLRPISSVNQINKCVSILKTKPKIKRTMWSRRAQEYDAKIFSGDPIKIGEVVRDLFRKNSQPEQSYSERQMFQVALERLAREVAAAEKSDYFQATEKIETTLYNK